MNDKASRKGKRAARESWEGQETDPPIPVSPPPTWGSRLASSASGLARDLVARPDNEALSHYAAAGVNGTSKAGPSSGSSSQSSWQEATSQRTGVSIHNQGANLASSSQGFRSTFELPQQNFSRDLDQFLAEGRPELQLQSTFLQSPLNPQVESAAVTEPAPPALSPPPQQRQHLPVGRPRLACDFQRFHGKPVLQTDGQMITTLLSRTEMMDLDEPTLQMAHAAAEPTEQTALDLFGPQNYTAQEQQIFDSIKASLPPPPSQHAAPPRPLLQPISLIPGVGDLAQSLEDGEGSYLNYDTPTREHWLHEWDGVLNRYMDDVWGSGLGSANGGGGGTAAAAVPDIEKVRSKLQAVAAKRDVLDSSAVSRLKMILGHMTQEPGTVDAHVAAEHQPQDEEMADGDMQGPGFRCTWADCNMHFHSLAELQQHSSSHQRLECPQAGCVANFSTKEEWHEHFTLAHESGLRDQRTQYNGGHGMEVEVES